LKTLLGPPVYLLYSIVSNYGKLCNIKSVTTIDIGGAFMQNNCIFCKIIAGEIPSATVYEDEDFKVIMDISPAAQGHTIILPKKHSGNLFELDIDTASKALVVARKVAIAMEQELKCDGINLLQNNGEAAGQTVHHFHIHLVPRYLGDQVKMTWVQGSYAEGEAAVIAAAIAARL
jgi:histidine triad (HIT) family protein